MSSTSSSSFSNTANATISTRTAKQRKSLYELLHEDDDDDDDDDGEVDSHSNDIAAAAVAAVTTKDGHKLGGSNVYKNVNVIDLLHDNDSDSESEDDSDEVTKQSQLPENNRDENDNDGNANAIANEAADRGTQQYVSSSISVAATPSHDHDIISHAHAHTDIDIDMDMDALQYQPSSSSPSIATPSHHDATVDSHPNTSVSSHTHTASRTINGSNIAFSNALLNGTHSRYDNDGDDDEYNDLLNELTHTRTHKQTPTQSDSNHTLDRSTINSSDILNDIIQDDDDGDDEPVDHIKRTSSTSSNMSPRTHTVQPLTPPLTLTNRSSSTYEPQLTAELKRQGVPPPPTYTYHDMMSGEGTNNYALYLRWICQYCPHDMYRYLQSHQFTDDDAAQKQLHNIAFQLCTEYHIHDALSYLYEQQGKTEEALQLLLTKLRDSFSRLDHVLQRHHATRAHHTHTLTSDTHEHDEKELQNNMNGSHKLTGTAIALAEAEKEVFTTLQQCTSLCIREYDDDTLWYTVLDTCVHIEQSIRDKDELLASDIASRVLYDAVNTMIPYVKDGSALMRHFLHQISSSALHEYRHLIQHIMSMYFHTHYYLLNTSKSIAMNERHTLLKQYVTLRKHAYQIDQSNTMYCIICKKALNSNTHTQHDIYIYSCYHIAHQSCYVKQQLSTEAVAVTAASSGGMNQCILCNDINPLNVNTPSHTSTSSAVSTESSNAGSESTYTISPHTEKSVAELSKRLNTLHHQFTQQRASYAQLQGETKLFQSVASNHNSNRVNSIR